ncbi:unnamed protein product [Lymnaea stagnalis]|uniref:SAP domain-containing protein n=1 Tax=Lymnaea stagnalis TaxID=6523 RepID=A0AAV2HSI7_LYMST
MRHFSYCSITTSTMADEENDSRSDSEKPEVKESISESEEPEKADEDSTKKEDSKKEIKSPQKVEKSPKKESKSPKKDEGSKKLVKNEEKKEDDEGNEEDSDEDEELPPGLLEVPLVVEGKREKKKVERLSATMIRSPQEKKKVEIEEGSGDKLGEIPFIEHQLNTTKAIDLKPLHKVLFLRPGSNTEIKKNIRQFSGFSHSKDSKEHEKRMSVLNKMVLAELKSICLVLGLERGGTKPNLVERIENFLMKPEDKGLKVKTKSKYVIAKSKSGGGKKAGSKRKRASKGDKKKAKVDKDDDDSKEDSGDDDEEDQDEEEKEDEEEEEPESEDESFLFSDRKSVKIHIFKNLLKFLLLTYINMSYIKLKIILSRTTCTADDDLSDSLSADSDDEPVAKIIKKSPPSNDEVKELVKKILDGADLEKVTMKTVVKQVYAKYPSFDLSDRKDFIKDTVREVIS